MIKPIFKYPGGKAKLLDRIFDAIPPEAGHGRFLDVFTGTGVVGVNALERGLCRQLWLNDIGRDVMTVHQALQADVAAVLAAAAEFFVPENDTPSRYYQLRELYNTTLSEPVTRAGLFLWLTRAAFNGLVRTNLAGKFNTPAGKHSHPPELDEQKVRDFAAMLSGARLTRHSFELVLAEAGPGDVVFCDPPYTPLPGSKSFTQYGTTQAFGREAHLRLAAMARDAAARGATVLICNHATPETRELYCGCQVTEFLVQRSIAAKGEKRKKVCELIAVFSPAAKEVPAAS